MRKIVLVIAFFPFTALLLVANLALLAHYSDEGVTRLNAIAPSNTNFNLTAAGNTSQVINAMVIAADARPLLLRAFMAKHDSPLTDYAETFVAEADMYGLDYRLAPSIAMCESNLGKRMPLKAGYNAFGIAVYTGTNKGKNFDSWVSSIHWVSKYIKEQYYDKGYTDLKDIGAIWAPPSKENGYSWTNCVQSFMNSII